MSKLFNSLWLAGYDARTAPPTRQPAPQDAEPLEADLHDKIDAECRRRGWVTVHSRMDRATTTAVGLCDFIIFADGGVVINIECKSRSGKLSLPQLSFIAAMKRCGHEVHTVRSFSEFMRIVPQGIKL